MNRKKWVKTKPALLRHQQTLNWEELWITTEQELKSEENSETKKLVGVTRKSNKEKRNTKMCSLIISGKKWGKVLMEKVQGTNILEAKYLTKK